ncbi:MAG: YciI family protein [Lautropia sp.]|nr:YciI family protein [Lautropia sp.]
MFVVSLSYIKPLSEVERHLEAHRAWLDRQYQAGVLLMSGRKEPRTGGIILMKADSLAHAASILAEDPFQQHQLADYQITQFVPSKAAPGLEPLLEA